MKNLTTTLEHTKTTIQPEYVFIIYDKDSCYLRECSTLAEVAKFFKVTKQALSNHLRRSGQDKTNFSYKNFKIEHFDINGIY